MELKNFIGEVVINTATKMRFRLREITAPKIHVITEQLDGQRHFSYYAFPTINGDPISNGVLVFEKAGLKEPFLAAYDAHCRSEDGRMEEYGYWMRKD